MDDDELIAAMAGGDDTALRELFARNAPWLAARLRPLLPPAEVEDVLQESFLAAWRGARGYRPEGTPGGWLWGITRRQAALWLRRRGPDGLPLAAMAALAASDGQHGGDPAAAVVSRAELAEAVGDLGVVDDRRGGRVQAGDPRDVRLHLPQLGPAQQPHAGRDVLHQPGVLEDLQVLGHRRAAHRQPGRQLPDSQRPVGQPGDDGQARAVSQRTPPVSISVRIH